MLLPGRVREELQVVGLGFDGDQAVADAALAALAAFVRLSVTPRLTQHSATSAAARCRGNSSRTARSQCSSSR